MVHKLDKLEQRKCPLPKNNQYGKDMVTHLECAYCRFGRGYNKAGFRVDYFCSPFFFPVYKDDMKCMKCLRSNECLKQDKKLCMEELNQMLKEMNLIPNDVKRDGESVSESVSVSEGEREREREGGRGRVGE